ncbi:uncharacterized protein TRAVEDRAFT_51022 [Trametes versicolor FP-101664 SS1]|uniref:uncharacterized protein n=1 Tax=Trametes versicolor (strain FP-101664) TaxID=717944 RepID=UPI00046226B7|nr:uncharacterized protein TRAVEDRAFT_51022 [Trametes versicolor FP-101664 SS1]EIW54886.1 hypothetical protein TRAVEDRAFT_51022 [Trametes versicolor FP-101664 SS1]
MPLSWESRQVMLSIFKATKNARYTLKWIHFNDAMAELGFEITQAGVVLTYAVPPRWGGGSLVLHMVHTVALPERLAQSLIFLLQDHEWKMEKSQQDYVKTRLSHAFGWDKWTFIWCADAGSLDWNSARGHAHLRHAIRHAPRWRRVSGQNAHPLGDDAHSFPPSRTPSLPRAPLPSLAHSFPPSRTRSAATRSPSAPQRLSASASRVGALARRPVAEPAHAHARPSHTRSAATRSPSAPAPREPCAPPRLWTRTRPPRAYSLGGHPPVLNDSASGPSPPASPPHPHTPARSISTPRTHAGEEAGKPDALTGAAAAREKLSRRAERLRLGSLRAPPRLWTRTRPPRAYSLGGHPPVLNDSASGPSPPASPPHPHTPARSISTPRTHAGEEAGKPDALTARPALWRGYALPRRAEELPRRARSSRGAQRSSEQLRAAPRRAQEL